MIGIGKIVFAKGGITEIIEHRHVLKVTDGKGQVPEKTVSGKKFPVDLMKGREHEIDFNPVRGGASEDPVEKGQFRVVNSPIS